MGLQSAMTTALTGLQSAETTIDVTGNNVANSNTVGFKESAVLFATQFLQTASIGSAPSAQRGGTNPRQVGLGVKVSEVRPDFSQGTIEIGSSPLDVAIQGDGFLVAQGSQGESLYTRAGQLSTNAENQIVLPTGHRILGYAVDDDFIIDESDQVPIRIPLGEEAVAQPTQNVFLTGTLTPTAAEGDVAGVIESQVLGDVSIEFPDPSQPGFFSLSDVNEVIPPAVSGLTYTGIGGGVVEAGNYRYRIVYSDTALAGQTNPDVIRRHEGPASVVSASVAVAANGRVDIQNLPAPSGAFTHVRIYRTDATGTGTYRLVGEVPSGTATFTDNVNNAAWTANVALDDSAVGLASYSYYVTYFNSADGIESRPTPQVGSIPIAEDPRRIRLANLPQPDADPNNGDWDKIRIYRNIETDTSAFYLVDELDLGETSYIDGATDADIVATGTTVDLDGPKINTGSLVQDIVVRDGVNYNQPFGQSGTISFAGKRGGRSLVQKQLEITATTTVQQLIDFMRQALGIHQSSSQPANPLPSGAGVQMSNGKIVVTSNRGIENSITIPLTAFSFLPTGGTTNQPAPINFSQVQDATGEGATTDFIVYDSLGIPLSVRVSTVVEAKDGNSTTYRWYAFSSDNEPITGVDTAVGNGILVFDNVGELLDGDQATIAIQRNLTASASPLEIDLNFDQVSGLAQVDNLNQPVSTLSAPRQDGFAPGVLSSFIITETGLIRGVFSNGAERPLGQLLLARFANNGGLQGVGDNLFQVGVNSGDAVLGLPGESGLGTLLGGAVELSNTDIGQNLIELILASTQYRGNARVISVAQDLLDELLALRR